MLPGGMMPVVQVAAMIRSTSARSGVDLLAGMPGDRLRHVVAALKPRDVLRLLPAMRPEFRDTVIDALSAEQLTGMLRLVPADQVPALVGMLPADRLPSVAAALPDQLVVTMMADLPEERRSALRQAVDPSRLTQALSTAYEDAVAAALQRANAEVLVHEGLPRGTVVARTMGRYVVVVARHGDDGRWAVRHAEQMAYQLRAHAALSVTDHEPAEDVARYCREARRAGRPVDAVLWVDGQYDGLLKRALVSLVQVG